MQNVPMLAVGLLTVAIGTATADTPRSMPFSVSHGAILGSLLQNEVLKDGRLLVHLSHTCNLVVEGKSLPVVDVRELVKGASTPRGISRIVVLDGALTPLHAIEYGSARPLFCRGNRLFLYNDISIDVVSPEGNVLVFGEGAATISTETIDPNDFPAPKIEDGKIAGE